MFMPPTNNYPTPLPMPVESDAIRSRADMTDATINYNPEMPTGGFIPPFVSEGQNPNRFQGRLRHGRGLPPGQMRQRFGQYQEQGGAFEPGWRKMLRQRQMQSMNGGGYQAVPDWSSIFTNPASPYYTPPTQGQPPQGGMAYNDIPTPEQIAQGRRRAANMPPMAIDPNPQPYLSPGFQAPPQGGMTSFVPDRGVNQAPPQWQMANRGDYFDPFVGPF